MARRSKQMKLTTTEETIRLKDGAAGLLGVSRNRVYMPIRNHRRDEQRKGAQGRVASDPAL